MARRKRCVVKRKRKEKGKRRKKRRKVGKIGDQIAKKGSPCESFSFAQSSFFWPIKNVLFREKQIISTFISMQSFFRWANLVDFQWLNIHPIPFLATLSKSSGSPKDKKKKKKKKKKKREPILPRIGYTSIEFHTNPCSNAWKRWSDQYLESLYILSTTIAYLCVNDAKHFLNDPHCDKNAVMSNVLIPYDNAIYRPYTVWI